MQMMCGANQGRSGFSSFSVFVGCALIGVCGASVLMCCAVLVMAQHALAFVVGFGLTLNVFICSARHDSSFAYTIGRK